MSQVAQNISVVLSGETLDETLDYLITTNAGGTNAGSYPIIVTGENAFDKTATGTFVISKAAGSVTTAPTAKSLTYNGSAQALVNAGSGTGTMMYKLDSGSWGTAIPSATTAGTYTVYYKASASTNYSESASGSVIASIAKVTPTVTAPTAKSLTYNTSAQELVNAGSTDYGTLKYSLDGSTYGTGIPTGTNAGSYTVYYRVDGDSNVESVTAKTVSVTISAKTVSSPTITLDPSSYTYNGTARKPTPTVKDGNTVIPSSEYTVTYSNNTNAGTATCTITDKSGGNYTVSGSKTFTINKASGSVKTAPTAKSLTYNGSAQALVNAGASDTGTMLYKLGTGDWGTAIPSGTNATNYTVYYKASASTNYNESASGSVSVTINKVTPTVTAPTAKSLTYNGSAQALATAGSTNWGTLQYSSASAGIYTTAMISGTNAGDYEVWYKVVGDSNINDVAPQSIECSIAKATPTYTAPTAKSLTYNGNAQALLNAGSVTGGTIYYSSDNTNWSTTIPTGTNANTYTSYWKITGDSNHNDKASASISTTIAKASGNVSTKPTAKSLTYNGSAQALVNAGSGTGTMMYKLGTGDWGTAIPSGTNATTYTVYYKASASTNYNESASGSVSVTISKVTPTVTAPTAKSLTYNGSAQALATAGSTNWGTLQYSSSESGTYSTAIPSGTNATSYEVWYKVVGDSNINNVAPAKITVTIAKANPTYTAPTANNKTYTGSAIALLNAGSTSHGTIKYSTSQTGTYSTTIPTQTNAGTYTTWWKLEGDSNHNDVAAASISTTISKAAGSVTTAPTKKTLTYNNTYQALVNAGSGTGTMLYKLGSGSWGESIPTGKDAGDYTVYYKASASTNYNESASGSVSVNIAKVTPTVTAPTAKSLTYNGNPQTLANAGSTDWGTLQYSLDGSSYTTSVPTATSAGDYTVYYKVVGNANINNVAAKTIACSIAKANPTYTAPTKKNSTYNASAQALLNAGSTSHGTFKYSSDGSTWSDTIPTQTNAGTYSAYWKLDGDSNHNSVGSTKISDITISKVTPTVTAPTAKVLTYNGSAQALATAGSTNFGTLVYSTTSSGTYSTTMPSGTNAGSYEVWYKVNGDSNVNSTTATKVACSIAEKRVTTPTITLSPASYTYSGNECKPTPTVKDGSTVIPSSEYNVVYSNNTNAGTATVTITDKNAGNYYISGTTTFTISKVTPTVTAPKATTYSYNGAARDLVSGGSTNWGSLQYSTASAGTYSTTIPTQTNAGSYEVWYKVVGDSNINSTNPVKVACSIAKATGTATVAGTSNTYNGSAKNLVTVSNNTGTMHYKVDSGGWSTTLPQATNAGSWTIYWYMDESSNYTGIASASTRYVSSSIGKADQSAPTATGASTTYHNTATATAGGGGKQGSLEWYNNTSTRTATGSTTGVKARWAGNSNYNASAWSNEVTLTVNKATDQSVTVTLTNRTYNTSAQVVASATSHGITNYYLGFGSSSTSAPSSWGSANSSISQTNAGTYYVWYKGTADGNHSADISATYKGSVSIGKADQSAPTATGATTTYNTTATATASGGGGKGSIEWSNGNTQTSVGSKTTKARWSGNSNYNASPYSNEVTLTMNKANQNAPTATVTTATYPGTSTASASGGGGHGTLTWTNGSSRTAIGTQDTYAYWAGDGNYNASPNSNKVTLSVAKFTPTVTLAATDRAYNGNPLYATASVATPSGGKTMKGTIYYGTTSGAQTYSVTYGGSGSVNLSSVSVTNVGSATVYAYFVPDSTCNDVYNNSGNVSKTFTVSKANISPTVTMAGWTYGGTATNPSVAGNSGGGAVTYNYKVSTAADSTYTATKPSNAGTYTVRAQIAATTNYNSGTCTTNFTIAQKAISIPTPTGVSRAYNGSAATATFPAATGAGITKYRYSTNGSSWTETTSNPSQTNAGTLYTQAYYSANNNNYSGAGWTSSATITISKADGSVTINGTTSTYNNTAKALATVSNPTGTMHYSTNGTSWSTSIPTATNAGNYTVYWYMDASTNYNGISSASTRYVSSSIGKADQSAPGVTGATTTYPTTATAKASGGGGQGSIEWESAQSQTSVGSHTTRARWSGNSNYNASPWSSSVTVQMNKAAGSVTISGTSSSYNGSAKALATVSNNTGTMHYSTNGTSWSTSIPTATNAGNYTVYWYMDSSTNYEGISSSSTRYVSSSIAKIDPPISAYPTNRNVTYNGGSQYLLTGGTSSIAGSWAYSTGINAGSYTATWTFTPTDTTNYNTKSGTVAATIAKASRTLSWSSAPSDLEVGDTMTITAVPSAGSGDGAITYTSSNSNVVRVNGSTISGVSEGSCTITATIAAGTNYLSASIISDAITVENTAKGHAYVEIAGTKWATMNIGASSVTDYGQYFQWGDTTGYLSGDVGSMSTAYKKPFATNWSDYKFDNGSNTGIATAITKYSAGGGEAVLDLCDDAARLNWRGGWRMPTTAETQALFNAVNTAWTASYQGSGVAGLVCTDKTDSSKVLFFPAAGSCVNGSVNSVGSNGNYWSNSVFSQVMNAYNLYFNSGSAGWDGAIPCFFGLPVRGVLEKKNLNQ